MSTVKVSDTTEGRLETLAGDLSVPVEDAVDAIVEVVWANRALLSALREVPHMQPRNDWERKVLIASEQLRTHADLPSAADWSRASIYEDRHA